MELKKKTIRHVTKREWFDKFKSETRVYRPIKESVGEKTNSIFDFFRHFFDKCFKQLSHFDKDYMENKVRNPEKMVLTIISKK